MKTTKAGGVAIATAAALLFGTLMVSTASADEAKIKCTGVNSCKGQSSCKSAKNSCKGLGGCASGDNGCGGKNSCKGRGGCEVPMKIGHAALRKRTEKKQE